MRAARQARRGGITTALATGALAVLAPPAMADVGVGDVRIDETAGTATFAITRVVGPLAPQIVVGYGTSDETAVAPEDYTATSGQVTFPGSLLGGTEIRTVTVPVIDDSLFETNQSFALQISGPEIVDGAGAATIVDNDPAGATPPPAPAPGPAPPAVFGLGAPRLQRPATILVATACPAAARTCKGTVSVRTRPLRRTKIAELRRARTLGKRSFTLAGGRGRTVRIVLRKADRALLVRAGRISVQATSRVTDAARRTTKRTVSGRLVARTAHSD